MISIDFNISEQGDVDIKMSNSDLNKSSNATMQRQSPPHPLHRMQNMHAVALTEPIAALSGFSRASRVAFVSIQRLRA